MRIDDVDGMREMNISPGTASRRYARAIADLIFVHGFAHCDPHAANVLVRAGKAGWSGKAEPEIVLLDHGSLPL